MPLFIECVEHDITLGEICAPSQPPPNPTMKILYPNEHSTCRIWGRCPLGRWVCGVSVAEGF
jgi:hypothetical protein